MSVLIKPDTITVLVPSRDLDEHGWAQDPELVESGTVTGTIQEAPPTSDPTASGSGSGPAEPLHYRVGVAYLDGPVQPGEVLRSRDCDWRAERVRFVEDPTGSGTLDCWVVDVSEVTYGEK